MVFLPFLSSGTCKLNKESPADFAKRLTVNDSTDKQKVTSIFLWITNNIAYNVRSLQNGKTNNAGYWLEEDNDSSSPLKPLNLRIAENIFARRTAVCDGYARLFKVMCDAIGVRCEIVTGFGRVSAGRFGPNFRSNHKWNVVFLDTAWFLLDATWASGYINYKNEFEWHYNGHYFLTPPTEFILDHYPEDLRWTLLPSQPLADEYEETPFKTAAFSRNYITFFSPESGIINTVLGDSIVIVLENSRPKKKIWVSDFSYTDSNSIAIMQCCGAVKPINKLERNKVSCIYHVIDINARWLYVIYDDEMILRYQLNIKRPAGF
ncbi:MAG TPA: transglutaminase domain-containing protein [Panacibacter sp.]|nr:transglutaminase domain-containing protein [Panacibacter sp.]HNP43161.1 transglutaminase domain-containing protein [Panacibacter sp.]